MGENPGRTTEENSIYLHQLTPLDHSNTPLDHSASPLNFAIWPETESYLRYNENREILKSGMAKLGFQEFVAEKYAGYIITSYLTPSDLKSDFDQFHEKLSEKGQVIYPGKVTDADTFRIGNIGHLFPQDMKVLLTHTEKSKFLRPIFKIC